MKLAASLLAAAALLLAACQSPTTPTPAQREAQIAKVSYAVEGVSAAGVAFYLAKNPASATYFTAAATIIEATANAGTLQPQAVQDALRTQLQGPEAAATTAALTAAFGLYQAFYGVNVDAAFDTAPAYRAALLALARGVRTGASGSPPASPTASAPLRIPDDLVLR